jgi:membrane fusion protein, multidrug efflux system
MNKKQTKTLAYSLIGLVAIVLIAYQMGWLNLSANESKKAQSQEAKPPANLETLVKALIVSQTSLVDQIQVTGTILPNEEVTLTSEVGGMIQAINFTEGSPIAQGSILVKLNSSDLSAQLEKLTYRANLLENKEKRQAKLLEKGGVSQEEYESSLAEWNAVKAEIKELNARILKTEIRAPFSGTIGLRSVSKGSYINPGTNIARIVNLDMLKAEFSIPEKYSIQIQKGQKVIINHEGERTYEAQIYAVEPKINLNTRTVTAKAIFQNTDKSLMPGTFVNIKIILKQYEKAIQIPTSALIPELGGQKVYKYQAGKAVPIKVETGVRGNENVQVINGLQMGDTLITSGLLNLRPNIEVKLVKVN